MDKKITSKIYWLYLFSIGALFLYSFTQIDLGLALTRFPFFYSIQQAFQYIGYFNRPASTYLYSAIVVLLFFCYGSLLYAAYKKQITIEKAWKLFFVTAGILAFSYTAFSYDIFNYIFDAKIFTQYGLNPYEHKALDFPQDPMLGFMHWTHRTYPYGPVWLGLTIPLSYIGFQYFLPTYFLFKVLAASSYLGTIYFIQKIMKKISPDKALFSIVFFGFNPLVIVEGIVSGHIDIVMMCLAMGSVYLLLEKRYILATVLFLLSVGVKFATVFFLPVFLTIVVLQLVKTKIPWKSVWFTGIGCMLLSVLAASQTSGNFQPWYLLTVLPLVALVAERYYVVIPTFVISFFVLCSYIPFLYLGNWDKPVPEILLWIYGVGVLSAIVLSVIVGLRFSSKVKVKSSK